MLSDRPIRRFLKPLVFAASLSPLALLLGDLWVQRLNMNPNVIIRSTGFWSLRFLCITLAITPLRWLTGWHFIVKFRRMMGLFGFFYAIVHTAAYIVFGPLAGLDASLLGRPLAAAARTLSAIGVDLLRPFFAIGLVALALMTPLAVTSTAGMIRRFGGRRWQTLHRLVYAVAVASVLHTYWPLIPRAPRYAVIVCLLFLVRVSRAYVPDLPKVWTARRTNFARTVLRGLPTGRSVNS
jgi:methionine sulfoxide reductase heme-binding subunit